MATTALLTCTSYTKRITANNKLLVNDADGNTHATSLLSKTHDMACYSWSIPAGHSCPSAVYGEGTICGSCYAMLNRYGMPNVADAQWLRFIWTKYLLKHNPQLWIGTMVANIIKVSTKGKNAVPFFRWHDSGDMYHVTYIKAIIEVCKATPMVKHWLPTRGWQTNRKPIARDSAWHAALLELSQLDNVVVRSSALDFNAAAPSTPYGPSSTAYTEAVSDDIVMLDDVAHHACPKSKGEQYIDDAGITQNASTCAECDCRRCWDKDGGDVAYYVHGWQGRHTAGQLSESGHAKRNERKQRFQALTISAVA